MIGLTDLARARRWLLIIAVVSSPAVGLLAACGDDEGDGTVPAPSPTAVAEATAEPTPGGSVVALSAAEVAEHGSIDDCWLIINNKVYDVTDYISLHPGGTRVITPYCGKEATEPMETRGEGASHSRIAWEHLESLHVGDLAP